MTNSSETTDKKATFNASRNPLIFTLAVQLLVILPTVAVLYYVNPLWMRSFFLGATVYVLPNAYFTLYAFRFQHAASSYHMVRSFYTGEFGKLALAAVGFALVFRFVTPLHAPSLIAGFICLVVAQWIISWQIAKKLHFKGTH
jgi:ATP synthase protein I